MSPVASSSPETESAVLTEKTAKTQYRISRVAVLGAGTMGTRIAAHIANAGLPVLLLDMVAGTGERSALAKTTLDTLKKAKPAAFASVAAASLVKTGNFGDDLQSIAECDWVIEVVAEIWQSSRRC